LAAAFAVGAHFSTRTDPAIVSMPTGTGKSGAMTLVPFTLSATRVLVITPSKLLRGQMAAEFAALTILRGARCIPEDMLPPSTREVAAQLTDAEAWEALRGYDVVVGTPSVLSPAHSAVAAPPDDLFDVLLFDEAHHTAAPTYAELLKRFPAASAVLFTATPFRRDRQPLPGRDVYSYGLAQALEEGVLAPVDFRPVDVPADADQAIKDAALAAEARARMDTPQHVNADSRIIARTTSVQHARELVVVYRRAGLQMGLITASTSRRQLRETLAAAREGDLAGFISVGVLGEGFDFPTLKIGAYHQRHASLPATLQFLGRISRAVPTGVGGELIAIAEEVNDETRELYASDVAWATLLPRLADAATQGEADRRNYVRSFEPVPTDPLSLAAIRPRKDVQVFEAPPPSALDLRATVERLGAGNVIYHGVDAAGQVAVVITEHLERPEWIEADTLDRFRYELHVVFHDQRRSLLFAHGSRDASILELLAVLGYSEPMLVDPVWLDRLLTSVAIADYHSVGMRSARAAGGRLAAYRMMAGTSVGDAVLPSETRSYGTGHAIARVRDPMTVTAADLVSGTPPIGAITSLGVSYGRAKVFSPDHTQLLEFRRWCERLGELVAAQGATTPAGPPALALLSPRRMTAFPDVPYLALLEPSLVGQGLRVLDTTTGVIVALEELEFTAAAIDGTHLRVQATSEHATWSATLEISGELTAATTWEIRTPRGDGERLDAFLRVNPLTIFYASGASSIGNIMFQPRAEYPPVDTEVLLQWDFDGVDIRAEHVGARRGMSTVKSFTVDAISATSEYVIDDDRAGEVADLIAISPPNTAGVFDVRLIHLKASSTASPGARVEDLYDLLGQASRSVVWCDGQRMAARLLGRLTTGSVVRKGEASNLLALLRSWSEHPVAIRWSIAAVQPGLRADQVNPSQNMRIMLNDFVEWVAQHDVNPLVFAHS
jgi:superfamily II DNA or RNA helicase